MWRAPRPPLFRGVERRWARARRCLRTFHTHIPPRARCIFVGVREIFEDVTLVFAARGSKWRLQCADAGGEQRRRAEQGRQGWRSLHVSEWVKRAKKWACGTRVRTRDCTAAAAHCNAQSAMQRARAAAAWFYLPCDQYPALARARLQHPSRLSHGRQTCAIPRAHAWCAPLTAGLPVRARRWRAGFSRREGRRRAASCGGSTFTSTSRRH